MSRRFREKAAYRCRRISTKNDVRRPVNTCRLIEEIKLVNLKKFRTPFESFTYFRPKESSFICESIPSGLWYKISSGTCSISILPSRKNLESMGKRSEAFLIVITSTFPLSSLSEGKYCIRLHLIYLLTSLLVPRPLFDNILATLCSVTFFVLTLFLARPLSLAFVNSFFWFIAFV